MVSLVFSFWIIVFLVPNIPTTHFSIRCRWSMGKKPEKFICVFPSRNKSNLGVSLRARRNHISYFLHFSSATDMNNVCWFEISPKMFMYRQLMVPFVIIKISMRITTNQKAWEFERRHVGSFNFPWKNCEKNDVKRAMTFMLAIIRSGCNKKNSNNCLGNDKNAAWTIRCGFLVEKKAQSHRIGIRTSDAICPIWKTRILLNLTDACFPSSWEEGKKITKQAFKCLNFDVSFVCCAFEKNSH